MKKIKLVYNLIGRFGPANNANELNSDLFELVANNRNIPGYVSAHFQNIVDLLNNGDVFELATPYNLRHDDYFIYEVPWNTFQIGDQVLNNMAPEVLSGIRHGYGYLLINDSVDPIETHRVEESLQFTDAWAIPRERVIYLAGAIDIDNIDNRWGIKFIRPDWNEIVVSSKIGEFADMDTSGLTKLNKFICLNRMWQHHRVILLWKLYRAGLLEHFDISFLKNPPVGSDTYPEALRRYAYGHVAEEETVNLDAEAERINALLPLVVDDVTKLNTHQSHSYILDHTRYYFYVVPETTFFNYRGTHFHGVHASEKVFKPILYKMPFIVIGPAGTLAALRKKGYMTFNNVIDESYDTIVDDKLRFDAIIKLFKEISTKSTQELEDILAKTRAAREHNFFHLSRRGTIATNELVDSVKLLFRDFE